jgi:MFS family permease
LFGRIADAIPLRTAFVGAIALQTLGWGAMLFDPGAGLLTAIAVTMGLSAGGRLPVWSAMLAAVFGVRSFGRAMGLMGPMMLPVAFAGPPLAGYIHDQTGSYQLAFQLGLGLLIAAAAFAFTLRLPKHGA